MRDYDLRIAITSKIKEDHKGQNDTFLVNELDLAITGARVDLALLNGYFTGYEIKSSQDNLKRLPSQLIAYTKIFDFLFIVTELKHLEAIKRISPDWVGIHTCYFCDGVLKTQVSREAVLNNSQDGFSLAKLLFKQELISLLESTSIDFKKSERAWILSEKLASNLEIDELKSLVREKLKQRIKANILLKQVA